MGLTAELRGFLPMYPAGLLTRPADFLTARRLAGSLRADGLPYGGPRGPRRTVSDLLVFRLDGGAAPPLVVKHPRSPRAMAALERECEVVERLEHDERLAPWHRFVPRVEQRRLHGPLPLVAQRCLPGVEGDVLLQRFPQLSREAAMSALHAIRGLHLATGRAEEVTARLGGWIDPRLAVLAQEVRWCRRSRGADAMSVLRDRLLRTLSGRSLLVGWTHGDFHPGNVLLARERAGVLGVIDWVGAVPDGPSAIDCYTFVLTMRHQHEGSQFGRVVADAVRHASLRPEDRRLLTEAGEPAMDSQGETALTLLTWLWHVAGNVAKSARYGRSHRWVAENVVPVLSEVAAQADP